MGVTPAGPSFSSSSIEHKHLASESDMRIQTIWENNATPSDRASLKRNLKRLNDELNKHEGTDQFAVNKLTARLNKVFSKFNCQTNESKLSLIRNEFQDYDAVARYLGTHLSTKYTEHFSPESKEWLENADLKTQRALSFLFNEQEVPFGAILSPAIENTLKTKIFEGDGYDNFAKPYQECREKLEQQIADFTSVTTEIYAADDPRKTLHDLNIQDTALSKSQNGFGGAYFVKSDDKLTAIVKPCSEDVGGIDNKKGYASPFFTQNVSRPVENYSSAARETFAYELAHHLGCESSIPPTILAVVKNASFNSFFDHPIIKETLSNCPEHVSRDIIALLGGEPSPNRLCSVQQAVNDAQELNAILLDWNSAEEKPKFNQLRFEDVMFMTRLLGETDGHPSNFLCTEEKGEWMLTKIDSGFCMPNKNFSFNNCLTALPNAREPISDAYRDRVITFGENSALLDTLGEKYKLSKESIDMAKERAKFMEALVIQFPHITHREFELRLRLFCGIGYNKFNETYEVRRQFALGNYSRTQLQELKMINRSQYRVTDSKIAHEQVKTGGLAKNIERKKKEEPEFFLDFNLVEEITNYEPGANKKPDEDFNIDDEGY